MKDSILRAMYHLRCDAVADPAYSRPYGMSSAVPKIPEWRA